MLSYSSGSYEGVYIFPAFFSNARRQEDFDKMVTYAMITIAILLTTFGSVCLNAYGTQIQEMIFLNQSPGPIQLFINSIFSLCMMYNCVYNVISAVDIIKTRYTVNFHPVYLPIAVLIPCILFSIYFNHLTLFFNINSMLCANMMQIILPNYMVIMIMREE